MSRGIASGVRRLLAAIRRVRMLVGHVAQRRRESRDHDADCVVRRLRDRRNVSNGGDGGLLGELRADDCVCGGEMLLRTAGHRGRRLRQRRRNGVGPRRLHTVGPRRRRSAAAGHGQPSRPIRLRSCPKRIRRSSSPATRP